MVVIKCQSLVASFAFTAHVLSGPAPLPARALPAILHPRIIDSTSLGATGLSSLQTLPGGRSVPGPQSEDDAAHSQTAAGEPLVAGLRYCK